MQGLASLAPFVLIAVIFWLLLIRPQRRRQLAMLETQRAVAVGDEVVLGAGIVGRVAGEEDDFLELEVSPGVVMKVARGAVVRVLQPDEPTAEADEEPSTGTDVPVDLTKPADPADPTDPTDPSRGH